MGSITKALRRSTDLPHHQHDRMSPQKSEAPAEPRVRPPVGDLLVGRNECGHVLRSVNERPSLLLVFLFGC